MKAQETSDAELIAMAALANCEAVLMAGENQMRQHQGYAPAYRDGTGFGEWGEKLRDEMHRRDRARKAEQALQGARDSPPGLFNLYVLHTDGRVKKLTGYAMTHAECCVMKSKLSEWSQARTLLVKEAK